MSHLVGSRESGVKHSILNKAFHFLIFFLALCATAAAQQRPEFRGVWIATVDNIDWPPKNSTPEEQRADFIRQLDLHARNGMNAVVVQVRPAADAFYPSPFEPWSQWLTGTQGKAPFPYYDPLAFGIEAAHARGFEYHAWANPYRAVFSVGRSSVAPNHISRLYPEWFLEYGGKLYFDPGNKEAQDWVVMVMRDVVRRYDVDAIHMDDYFYPYRIAGKEFPDTASYRRHGGGRPIDDWRRSNTDSIIRKLSQAIHETKPWVKFGISPFGIWRNKKDDPEGSATRGQTNYDDLYADILLWLEQGWIDYVAPQIYWEFGHPSAPYEVLVDWWNRHTYGRHCYIGLAPYRAGSNAAWKRKDQLPRQIQRLREKENIQGAIFYSSKSFNNNPNGWNDSLRTRIFRERVPVPEMPWLPSRESGVRSRE